jgi:serine/threonine protein kinase
MPNGEQLGPYRVLSKVGAGGMGEVYRATDTRLGREVALKVLPASLAHDPERLSRFEREARLLAALNHPGIAHVYGFEGAVGPDDSTTHVLAMEFVEGEDLSGRLQRGAIPVAEALAIATQIAEALEAAHEKGIVHRDLKPGNVKLTPDGTVKVLDFGLVRSIGGDEPGRAFRATTYEEQYGSFSPDGRWLAYESDETGRQEIYVEAFPGPGERFQVSADGGSEPLWAHGSGEIFYRRGDEMRVVRARTSPRVEFEPPRTLFTLTFSQWGSRARNYDVTPDGQRFVIGRVPDASAPRRIDLVTGWLDDLLRRVPTGR